MKKKNLISLLVVGALVGTMFTGCGDDTTVSKVDEDTYTVESTEASEAETTEAETTEVETTEVETTEVATTEEATTEAEEEVSDYLSENGLVVTPISSVTTIPFSWSINDEPWTVEQIPCTYSLTVTDNGDGYSDTVLVMDFDFTDFYNRAQNFEAGTTVAWMVWQTAFDRYTGYNFETTNNTVEGTGSTSDAYLIEVDGTVYDITITFDNEQPSETTWKGTCTVHHPTDYDGVVFHVDGYTSAHDAVSYDEPFKMLDYDGVVTENSLFFTATDN